MYISNIFKEETLKTLGKNNLIGKGSYGCVIKPPIITNYEKIYIEYNDIAQDDVGKLFKSGGEDNFKKELKILKGINNLDQDGDFTIKLKGANAFPDSLLLSNDNELKNCLDVKERTFKLLVYQIILENGGKEIEVLTKYSIPYEKFIRLFYIFLNGIKKMHSNNLIHRDIKPVNVLMSDTKISLIDFGISEDADKVYSKENYSYLSYLYPYYPIEFFIASILLKYRNDKDKFQNKLDTVIDILQENYLNNMFKEKKIYSIINEIQDFINEIKLRNYSYHDIFNADMAYKCDIYSLSFIIDKFANKIIYQNESQKILIYNLYKMCSEINPLKRASIDKLLSYIDEFQNIINLSHGGSYKMKRLVIPNIFNDNLNTKIHIYKNKNPYIVKFNK